MAALLIKTSPPWISQGFSTSQTPRLLLIYHEGHRIQNHLIHIFGYLQGDQLVEDVLAHLFRVPLLRTPHPGASAAQLDEYISGPHRVHPVPSSHDYLLAPADASLAQGSRVASQGAGTVSDLS